jgi:hypothetical protein
MHRLGVDDYVRLSYSTSMTKIEKVSVHIEGQTGCLPYFVVNKMFCPSRCQPLRRGVSAPLR